MAIKAIEEACPAAQKKRAGAEAAFLKKLAIRLGFIFPPSDV